MLDLIRKKQKTTIIKFVFWAIIATFVGTIFLVWGKGSDRSSGGDPNLAVQVNGDPISYAQYQNVYRNLYQLYQSIYREQFTPTLEKQLRLPQQAYDQVVDQTLLLQEADHRGIKVSKDELVKSIAEIPAFQENGQFTKERYLQVLNYQRLTPDEFEGMQRNQLLGEKVRAQLQEGVAVSDEEITADYRKQNEKVNLAFVRLAPALFESRIKVDDKELQTYFAEHREEFRLPEAISLSYLRFVPSRYAKDVVFEEGDLEKYYRRHLDRFEIQEQVKAAHILIKVDQNSSPEQKTARRKLAEKVLDEAKAGKDFADLARRYSDDPGSATKGGDLGYFPRGAMVKPFEQAAFSLKPGELSGIVESSFGFHIIKCEGYIEAGIKPLAEVTDAVKEGLRSEKASQLALEKALDAYNINRKGGTIEAAAKASDLEVQTTGLFSRDEAIDGLGNVPEIAAQAFALVPGELARPVALADGVILYSIKERRESRLPELAEVRERVINAYRQARAGDLARQTADALLAALKEGKSLATLAKKENLKIEETGSFARAYGDFVPRLGSNPEIAAAAFQLTTAEPVAPVVYDLDGQFVVVTLKSREEADMDALDATKRDEIRETLLTRKRNDAVTARLKELREKAEIVIAPALQSELEGK
ncbi:peptidyl-prolyl cis-trans isomerase [Desulfuromonas sp. DDH964]|uniref:SurA N-terminal domain-containing protein n=1 Tax=Desulfuromonas sp. DDH964 TaxID=1823759 RepID=UPI00078BAF28|nr:SurA N-terminal domain-containing protein [Desulfuromonas sp. DDH964]AMV72935.1 peptidyl-prolyl cis-trans isomerase [Desulfuromonas sp. DDH964]